MPRIAYGVSYVNQVPAVIARADNPTARALVYSLMSGVFEFLDIAGVARFDRVADELRQHARICGVCVLQFVYSGERLVVFAFTI